MVSAVNSANNYSADVKNSDKKHYVKNGAAIGAGVGLGYMTIQAAKVYRHNGFGKVAKEVIKKCGVSKNKAILATAGACAIAAASFIGIASAIGAGAGAIAKAVTGNPKK